MNGFDFSFPFERDYLPGDSVSVVELLGSPIFAIIMATFRAVTQERDTVKNIENWSARMEFEIAAKLEAKINRLIGAPLEGARSVWRFSLIAGTVLFLIAATTTSIFMYANPRPQDLKDGPIGRLTIAVLGGILFCGFPAGLGGLCLGLTFAGKDVEDSVSGQALLKLVGVKDSRGLRVVAIFGVILCFAVSVIAARMIFNR